MENDSEHDQNSLSSLVQIHASEAFPKKSPHFEETNLHVPFPPLCGEYVSYVGCIAEGVIAMSNFRLFVHMKNKVVNIPLGLLEYVECREIFFLYIYCKDARSIRCTFTTNDASLEWYKRLVSATTPPKRIEDVFAFAYFAWCSEENKDLHQTLYNLTESAKMADNSVRSCFRAEIQRMGFDLKSAWRISDVNKDYRICASYPCEILVPSTVKDEDLENVARFRSSQRVPVVVWRHPENGSVIARCSQPEVGWLGWRDSHDENLVQAIALACAIDGTNFREATNKLSITDQQESLSADFQKFEDTVSPAPKVLIMDARSYAAAVANRAKGGGCECPEYYPNCEIQFMSLANIHSIRKSFLSVRALCSTSSDQANWFSVLESTKWLQHISGLLKSALIVVNAIDIDNRPVLVHCSDGWDRTPQIVALSELLLDPYYRTIDGFQVLVEREWLEFGHKFGDRCGHGVQADDANERCPVFLQWLDCVYQLLRQFPCSFQFNTNYLVKLSHHVYSCLYGTFLCNSDQERKNLHVRERTYSVWAFLRNNKGRFKNYLYSRKDKVLRPSYLMRDLVFWTDMYLQACDSWDDPLSLASNVPNGSVIRESGDLPIGEDGMKNAVPNGGPNCANLVKTRSCADLCSAVEAALSKRRSSDSSINDVRCITNGLDSIVVNGSRDSAIHDDDVDDVANTRNHIDDNSKCITVDLKDQTVHMNGYANDDCESIESESFLKNNCCGLVVAVDNRKDPDSENDDTDKTVSEGRSCDFQPFSAIESSTDTIVEDLVTEVKRDGGAAAFDRTSPNFCSVCDVEGCLNGVQSCRPFCDGKFRCAHLESSAHVSTSTTDISDSHVAPNEATRRSSHYHYHQHVQHACTSQSSLVSAIASEQRTNGRGRHWTDLTIFSKYNNSVCTNCSNVSSSRSLCDDAELDTFRPLSCCVQPGSSAATPFHSRTPSSGFPATPNDERPLDGVMQRCVSSVARRLDIDGLPVLNDEVQQRLHEIHSERQRRINSLQHSLCLTKLALCQQICVRCSANIHGLDHPEEVVSLPDSVGSGEQQSLGNDSGGASDISWEQVEERDTRPTLWVPDHAVTRCMSCDSEFCIVRRKHHCRNCGKIFCADCSNQMTPIPNEQLYDPVRVCSLCFDQLKCKQIFNDSKFQKFISSSSAVTSG